MRNRSPQRCRDLPEVKATQPRSGDRDSRPMASAPDPGLCRTLCPLGPAPLDRWAVTAPWVLRAWLAHGCWAGSSVLPACPTALLSPFAPVSHLLALDLPFPLPVGRALRQLSGSARFSEPAFAMWVLTSQFLCRPALLKGGQMAVCRQAG